MPAVNEKRSAKHVLPRPVDRALRHLGQNISAARRMRRLSQEELAQRIDSSLSTVRRMEDGHPGTALHTFLRTMQVLGQLETLLQTTSLVNDDLGMELVREQLPQRIRTRSSKSVPGGRAGNTDRPNKDRSLSDELEGF